ncbi:MAG TPA: hypothetical protein VGU02_05000 [Gaiellaceae bacterium]|nr:hypothetical protein [Gaiellaceae bacterium]
MKRVRSDRGTISVEKSSGGHVLLYLNVTPRQSTETLRNWPAFRLDHVRDESKDVHNHGHASGLHFLGGAVGTCVTDDYMSRFKANHYREIACFVQGHHAASVLIAAALESRWKLALPVLERAISAFRAR